MNKKAISPVIATVLLMVIVVVIAMIIFLWAKGFVKESLVKNQENVDFVCDKIQLEATYISSTGDLQITNIGNIPVYKFNVRMRTEGTIRNLQAEESIPNGQSITKEIDSGLDEVKIVPILMGQDKKSSNKIAYVCKNEIITEIQ